MGPSRTFQDPRVPYKTPKELMGAFWILLDCYRIGLVAKPLKRNGQQRGLARNCFICSNWTQESERCNPMQFTVTGSIKTKRRKTIVWKLSWFASPSKTLVEIVVDWWQEKDSGGHAFPPTMAICNKKVLKKSFHPLWHWPLFRYYSKKRRENTCGGELGCWVRLTSHEKIVTFNFVKYADSPK